MAVLTGCGKEQEPPVGAERGASKYRPSTETPGHTETANNRLLRRDPAAVEREATLRRLIDENSPLSTVLVTQVAAHMGDYSPKILGEFLTKLNGDAREAFRNAYGNYLAALTDFAALSPYLEAIPTCPDRGVILAGIVWQSPVFDASTIQGFKQLARDNGDRTVIGLGMRQRLRMTP